MRDHTAALAYLEAERAACDERLASVAPAAAEVLAELIARTPDAERSVSQDHGSHAYYTLTPPGRELPELRRSRRLAGPSQLIPFAHVSAAARDAGIADAQAVGLVGLIGVGSLVGRFTIGALADRLGRPLTLVAMQAALGACFALWALAGSHYVVFALFAVCVGLSYGGIVSLMPALMMDLFGARAVSSILGTLYTGAGFGCLAGPWIAGFVFDRTGSYAFVIVLCGALSALATAATWLAVRGLPRPVH